MLTSIRESRTCFYGARKNYFMYDILSYCTAQITGHILGLWKISEIAFSFLWIFYYYFVCISILPACISLHHMHVWNLQRPKEDILDPLELEIEQVVSFHVVANYQTPVF